MVLHVPVSMTVTHIQVGAGDDFLGWYKSPRGLSAIDKPSSIASEAQWNITCDNEIKHESWRLRLSLSATSKLAGTCRNLICFEGGIRIAWFATNVI